MPLNLSCLNTLIRRKPINQESDETKLNRCLTTFDLVGLGIGSTLGLGVYVLAGQVAGKTAGPSVVLSFVIAGVASIFAGLCYAEFGARVPKAGSAYIYSYVTVGEFMAFVIGWNLILEYVIGTASVARGYSGYIDALINNQIKSHLSEWLPINIKYVSSYPDFFAFALTIILTIMLAIGVKESTRFNSIFTMINLCVVLFAVVAGSFKINTNNWSVPDDEAKNHTTKDHDTGHGGFFPFGFEGMMKGAATCFYGYVGFDAIATTGEEVKNPQKSIPISIVISLTIISIAYSSISIVSTLMWPYYDLNQSAPLPYVFDKVDFQVAKWVISIGALAGLSTSLLGGMFPLPRILYAMANDGLIFKILARIHPKLKTPVIATIISGIFAGIMATMFDVDELADMMSIGTLLAYSLVALSVLILRYQYENGNQNQIDNLNNYNNPNNYDNKQVDEHRSTDYILTLTPRRERINYFKEMFSNRSEIPTEISTRISLGIILMICTDIVVLHVLLRVYNEQLYKLELPLWVLIVASSIGLKILIQLILLSIQPKNQKKISFKVPWVPFIPVLSIFSNIYLMSQLSIITWVRFAVWLFIGFLIYFFYGINNSVGYKVEVKKIDENELN